MVRSVAQIDAQEGVKLALAQNEKSATTSSLLQSVASATSGSLGFEAESRYMIALADQLAEAEKSGDKQGVDAINKLVDVSQGRITRMAEIEARNTGTPIMFGQVEKGETRIQANLRGIGEIASRKATEEAKYLAAETNRARANLSKNTKGSAGR
jgi:hypothetical protein